VVDEVVEEGAVVVVRKGVGSFPIFDFYLDDPSSPVGVYLASNTVIFGRISSQCPREYKRLSHFTFQNNNINQPKLPKELQGKLEYCHRSPADDPLCNV
jgi:hypothetical protein